VRDIDATITITDAEGRVVDLSGSHTYAPATIERVPAALMGDLPGEGVDTVRWSEPVTGGPWRVQWIELPQKDQHASRMASTQSRRARRTAATKRQRANRHKRALPTFYLWNGGWWVFGRPPG
jgi:hypothetical protein